MPDSLPGIWQPDSWEPAGDTDPFLDYYAPQVQALVEQASLA